MFSNDSVVSFPVCSGREPVDYRCNDCKAADGTDHILSDADQHWEINRSLHKVRLDNVKIILLEFIITVGLLCSARKEALRSVFSLASAKR